MGLYPRVEGETPSAARSHRHPSYCDERRTPVLQGWTSAFTAQSILVQLQAFLLADDLLFDTSKVISWTTVPHSSLRRIVC